MTFDIRSQPLDLEILKRLSCDRLVRILEEIPGIKDLVIDGDLMKMLDRIANAKTLRDHGASKIFRLERLPPPIVNTQILYFIKPSMINIKYIADHIHSLRNQMTIIVHVVCVPRILSWINILLEEEGLYGMVTVHEFVPEFIPLDEDFLSLELHNFFKESFIENDNSSCISFARALNTVQSLYGSFSNIFGHGRAAQAVLKSLELIQEDQGVSTKSPSVNQIGHLFVFDRDADYVTPLLTQLTYEGALDEFFGIKAGVIEFPKDMTGPDVPSKVPLNGKDPIFSKIRNKHFGGVSADLKQKAKDLQEKKQDASQMTPAQMKNFVSNDLRYLQSLQKSLSLHISACEGITKSMRKDFETQLYTEHGLVTGGVGTSEARKFLKDCIARQVPSTQTMRLFGLYSITQDGLSTKEFESLSSQLLASHGHHHLLTIQNLKQSGLLAMASSNSVDEQSSSMKQTHIIRQVASTIGIKKTGHWQVLTKKLNLLPSADIEIDLHHPTHMSYVFNGAYTPLIPSLISDGLTKGLSSLAETVKVLPGATVLTSKEKSSAPKVAFIFILGGITFSEIAALRLLASSLSTKFIIASTSTTTGSALIKACVPS